MRDRAGGREHQAGDDREDRREGDAGDHGQEQVTAERALAAAEELRQVRRREVAALAGRLHALLAQERARAEADERRQQVEEADQEHRPHHRRARGLGVGHGEEAHQDVRQAGGAEHERQTERDRVQRLRQIGARAERERRLRGRVRLGPVEELDRVEADLGQHEDRHHEDARHQQHGLDDLHPRRGHHAAEDDVTEHERAGEDHRPREVDADQRLDQHARTDHLRDQVEGHDGERAERRRGPRGRLVQAERKHVGDRVLARVAHPLGEQEHHGEEGDEEADRVQEPVEAVEVDQAGDAEERRRGEVVAGDREAVLATGDLTARGVEADGARRALGRPVRDAERDREDDREDHDRLDVDFREQRHRVTSCARLAALEAPGLLVGERRLGDRVRERIELVLGLTQVPDAEHEDHQELRQRVAIADGQALVDRLGHEVGRVAGHDDERHVVGEEEDRRGYDEAPPP